MKVTNLENLTYSIAIRYYKFLLKYHKEDVDALAKSMKFIICGRADIGEASRTIQRHLYRVAREYGWKRQTIWIHPEKTNQNERIEQCMTEQIF